MKKPKPLLLVIFIAAAVAIIGYAYVIFGERYGFKEKKENANTNQSTIIDDFSDYLGGNDNENANANQNGNSNSNQNDNANVNANTNSPSREEINSSDCKNDCARYKGNDENYKYCQQVCGDIIPSQKESEGDCADLEGLEKDYCWRDLAVSKLDSSICKKISDQKLKDVCRNRVTEELLD